MEIAALIWEKNGDRYTFVNANAVSEPVLTTAINQIDLSLELIAQPNPFTNQTSIQYELKKLAKNAHLELVDISGKVIESYPIKQRRGQVEWQNPLTKGVYFARIKTEGGVSKVLKIIAL